MITLSNNHDVANRGGFSRLFYASFMLKPPEKKRCEHYGLLPSFQLRLEGNNMLTKKEWSLVKFTLKIYCKTHTVPFDWNDEQECLSRTSSKFKIWTSKFCFVSTFLYLAFVCVRVPSTVLNPDASVADCVMHFVTLSWYATIWIWQITNLSNQDSVALLFNQTAFLNIHHGSRFTGEPFAKSKYRHIFLKAFNNNLLPCVLVWAGVVIGARHQHFFVFSLFPENMQSKFYIITYVTFEILFVLQYYPTYTLLIFFQYMYLMSSKYWLQIVCIEWPKKVDNRSGASSKDPDLETTFQYYKSLNLINKVYNECYSSILIPSFKVMSCSCVIVSTYACIRFGHSMIPSMAVMLGFVALLQLAFVLCLCTFAAEFHDRTKRFPENFKTCIVKSEHYKYPLRFYIKRAKTCWPFGFRVGSFYFIKKITKISVVNLIVNGVLYLLISY
ncbi:unnamed protein product [Allacma fusca]|uniref:Uncharacterized protein n=1 Tax=Allacma fusca TaxID=39272 RepID=A0A8J2KY61_9HEXA|nr:unnamed protein product [Allacma fusca]